MKRFLVFLLTAMLFAVPVAAEEFGTRVSNLPPSQDHRVRIDSSLAVNDFSAPIAACPTMVITYEQATQAQVRVYATNRDDDTVAEIEAATVLADLDATSTSQTEVNPATSYVRVVVDQVETTGTSEVRIVCSNLAGLGGTTNFTQPSPSLGTEAGGLVYNITDPATTEYGYGASFGNSGGAFNETNNILGPYYNKAAVAGTGCVNQFEHAFDRSWEMSYNATATDDQTWVEENWDVYPAQNSANVSGQSAGFSAAVDVGDVISFGGTNTGIVVAWADPALTWIQNSGIAEASDTVTIDGETATLGAITDECGDGTSRWRPYLAIWDTVDNTVQYTWQTVSTGGNRNAFQVKNGGVAIGSDEAPTVGTKLQVEGTTASNPAAEIGFETEQDATYAGALRGLDIDMNWSATGVTYPSSSVWPGIYIRTTALGSGNTNEPTPRGIWIADMHNGTAIGGSSATIFIESQDSNDGSFSSQHGNFWMEGGSWNTGHLQFGTGQGQHIWFSGSLGSGENVFRISTHEDNGFRPLNETDGAQILTARPETDSTVCDADGSAQKPEGYMFYNDTSDYYCFCNGAGNDVQVHAPTTACF